jgi:hypothetical protein
MATAEFVRGHLTGVKHRLGEADPYLKGIGQDLGGYQGHVARIKDALGAVLGEMQQLRNDVDMNAQEGVFCTNTYLNEAEQVSNVSGDGQPLAPAVYNLSVARGNMESATVMLVGLTDFLDQSITVTNQIETDLGAYAGALDEHTQKVQEANGNVMAANNSIDARISWLEGR